MKLLPYILVALLLGVSMANDYSLCDSTKTYNTIKNQFNSAGIYENDKGDPLPSTVGPSYCFKNVQQSLIDTVRELYPEKTKTVSQLVSDKISFVPEADGIAYITYIDTGAGYKNRLGLYYYDNDNNLVLEPVVFSYVNTKYPDVKALRPGDTAMVNVKKDVRYGIVLFPDYWNSPKANLYSDFFSNPSLTPADGVGHVSWVKIVDKGGDPEKDYTIVFTFEDAINGDYDYNDIVFTLDLNVKADFEDLPVYDDGKIQKCIPLDTVTKTSYVEKDCFSWALLEKEETNACSFFMKPPKGWEIASYVTAPGEDNEAKRNLVIETLKNVPLWHKFECIGVMVNGEPVFLDPTTGEVGDCDSVEPKEGSSEGMEGCYAVDCQYRFLIMRTEPHEVCGDYDYCVKDTPVITSTYPSSDMGWIVHPLTMYTLEFKDIAHNMEISVSKSNSDPNVDVVVVFDLESVKNDNVGKMKNSVRQIALQQLSSISSNARLAVAGVHGNQFSVTRFTNEDELRDSDGWSEFYKNELKILERKSTSTNLMSLVNLASSCPNCAWRDESSTVRVIVFVTLKEPVSNPDVTTVLNNNHIMTFIGIDKGRGSDFKTFSEKFKNSDYAKLSDSSYSEYYGKISSIVNTVIGKSYLHVTDGEEYVEQIDGKSVGQQGTISFSSGKAKHTFRTKVTDLSELPDQISFNVFGRSKTVVDMKANRPPVASNGVLEFSMNAVEATTLDYTLVASDPDQGKLKYKLVSELSEEVTIVTSTKDENGYFENPNIKITVQAVAGESFDSLLSFVVSDGCVDTPFNVALQGVCSPDEETGEYSCHLVPKCTNTEYTVKRGVGLDITIPQPYFDQFGYEAGVDRNVKSIISDRPQEVFYNDNSRNNALEADDDLQDNIYFIADEMFSTEDEYILRYTVTNVNSNPGNPLQSECQVRVTVTPANDPPEYKGETEFTIDEDKFLTFSIDDKKVVYEVPNIAIRPDESRLMIYVDESYDQLCGVGETENCLTCCYTSDSGVSCSGENCLRARASEEKNVPTFRFTPYANDFGDDYATFPLLLEDKKQPTPAPSNVEVTLHVNPVNDAPTIEVIGDVKVVGGEGERGGINEMKKGSEFVFSWRVFDIDNLPRDLRTLVQAQTYTRNPWKAYSCTNNEEECSQPLDFTSSETVNSNLQSTVKCRNFDELKGQRGQGLEECYAEFTLRFVPQNSQSPYITFTLYGSDQQPVNGLSSPVRIQINVLQENLRPGVWSPPEIESTSSLVNIKVGQDTVNVTDDAPATWIVKLTMTAVSENGHFVLPSAASSKCESDEENEYVVVCKDTVIGINNWIKELRYNITNGDKEAELSFIVNDQGYPGLTGEALESDLVTTLITVDDTVIPVVPKSSSKLLIIALSVGAAGAIALGVAVALLRNKLRPPSDDYFQIGTDTVSTSPTSPLYVGQTKEGFSGLYSGAKA